MMAAGVNFKTSGPRSASPSARGETATTPGTAEPEVQRAGTRWKPYVWRVPLGKANRFPLLGHKLQAKAAGPFRVGNGETPADFENGRLGRHSPLPLGFPSKELANTLNRARQGLA